MSKRPASVTSLLFAVLSLTAWNALRLGAAIVDWDVLAEFAPRPGPLYIAATASFWILGGLAIWKAIRRRSHRVQLFTAVYFIGYAIWWWMDRLLLQSASPNWPFALALTILLLGLAAFELFNKKTFSYFRQRETHEQTITDQNPA
jgi:hypothetical protein